MISLPKVMFRDDGQLAGQHLAVCGKTLEIEVVLSLRVIASGVFDRSRRFWWSEQPPAYAAISLGMRIRL